MECYNTKHFSEAHPISIEQKFIQVVPDLSDDIRQRMEYKSHQRLQRRKCWKNIGLTISDVVAGVDLPQRDESSHELTNIDCISSEKFVQNVNFIKGKIAAQR
ncbi:unnamed protein product [Orchesella dallaii]|uniref:Uncharacterized protein n=1 Tax=Orchesella dallaii TaxID=48710 RepID=A0ABP1QC33_9HEXA